VSTSHRWRISDLSEQHLPAVFKLFEDVFGHEMTPSLWQWKYGEGRGQSRLVWRDAVLVAHYGGMTRDILFFGKPARACQIGDVMVLPSERGVLTRRGPFFLATSSFLEHYIGFGLKHLVGFGFPNSRAMKIAERLSLYKSVGRMAEITWTPLNRKPYITTYSHTITSIHDKQDIDILWARMARDLQDSLVGIRNWSYVKQRYLSHPQKKYEILIVRRRFLRKPLGLLVLCKEAEHCELIDMVAPLSSIPVLIEYARYVASNWNSTRLFCWITEQQAARFVQADGKLKPLDVYIPANIWNEGPNPEEINNRWWLMAGDIDWK